MQQAVVISVSENQFPGLKQLAVWDFITKQSMLQTTKQATNAGVEPLGSTRQRHGRLGLHLPPPAIPCLQNLRPLAWTFTPCAHLPVPRPRVERALGPLSLRSVSTGLSLSLTTCPVWGSSNPSPFPSLQPKCAHYELGSVEKAHDEWKGVHLGPW